MNRKLKTALRIASPTKKCGKCKEIKDKNIFIKCRSKTDGLSSYCKPCGRIRRLEWNEKNKGYSKNFDLLRKYNITLENYNIMLKNQNFSCAICNIHESKIHNKLAVDHDHNTGQIRALLCMNCNQGIGKFKDNLDLLQKAIDYLEFYNDKRLLLVKK